MDGRQTPQMLLTRNSIVPMGEIAADPASPLGKSSSAVFKGTWNNAVVAIKKLPSDTPPEALHSRIPLWESLKHSHVLDIFGVSPTDADPLFIVMQYHGNGCATQFLEQNPSADRSKILYETALGMQYIHNRGLVHGSLKPSNILIADYQQAVVADCGMCEIAPSINSLAHQYFGPDAWKGATSRGADVYAFGMSALEIFQSKLPWGTLPESKIYQLVVKENERPDRPEPDTEGRELIIDEVWSLIEECWQKDSRSRPSFNKILEIWPKPDPALTPLPPSTDSTFSQASPARLSLTESQLHDTLSRTPDIASPHEPPAYEAANHPVIASPVPVQRVRTTRLISAPSPWAQSSRNLPPPPLALGGNTNPSPISSHVFKASYNPNPPEPAVARRFSEGPANFNLHSSLSTRSNSWSPPPTSHPVTGGSGPSSSSGTATRDSYSQRTFVQSREMAPPSPSVVPPSAQYLPGQSRRYTHLSSSVNSIDEMQASSFEHGFQNLQVSEQPPQPSIQESEYPEQLPGPSSRSMLRYAQPSERGYEYDGTGGSIGVGSNPSVTGGPNALLLAQALHTEMSEGRDHNIISDHLVRIHRFAARSDKDAQRLVTAGVVPDLIILLRTRAIDFNGLDVVLVALGTLAHDPVTANLIYRVGAGATLMELLSSSLSDDIAAGSAWCLTRICRSTEVASGLIKQGIIKVLMDKGIVNAKQMTSQQSAWCLGTLIQTDSLADTMAAQGLIPAAVDHLRRVRSQNATGGDVSAATYLIARLARSIKLSRALAKAGAIPPLVHALKTSEDPQVLDWSARAIGCLMRPSSNDMSRLLLDAGAATGLARLPRVLADHEIDPLGSFAFAIQRFSVAEWGSGTRKALVDAGVVDSLLAALRTAADLPYPKVHIELALAVSFLGDVGGGDIRKEIMRAGGIDILKKVGAAGAPDVQKTCNMAVTSITGNLWTRNAASAKTALSHEWNGGAPIYVPAMPPFSTWAVQIFEGSP